MKRKVRIYYDKESDFLEISLGKPTASYTEELERGVFLRRDEQTNEIKSLGIIDFKKKTKKTPL